MKKLLIITLLPALLWTCTPKAGQKTTASPVNPNTPVQYDELGKPILDGNEPVPEYNLMDGVTVTPGTELAADTLPLYQASHTFEHDLIHTKLELRFDWAQKHVLGKATLTLRPWFYATDKLTLDAKGFDIHSVNLEGKSEPLRYDYDKEKLLVYLDRTYTRAETFKINVSYTAKPDERQDIGGSAAITSDKGLYFINPDGADKEKPMQIWTQGETEANSCWFPTIDKPNERCTDEIYVTVEDKYKTLSNGIMVSSTKNADGTRTDYWKMDKPHAPYLFMLAIGDYAVVHDKWNGIDVAYYVEPKYEPYARDIFPYTTEMLGFFSEKLGYTYPWPRFSQVIVRDYVSGAMENTTAVIFGEYVQKTKRELLDDHLTNEKVVAHEMFHHWFGDLVTTESWSNLTLNEGFANYSEYLWLEHKYGRETADEHLYNEQQGYFFSLMGGNGHPLIHFGYDDKENMFDGHSYNKGGCTLHMLRTYLGDEAFFAGLNLYLKRHEYTDVEAHELRLAFEDVSGQDLNWFFNQWFFGYGQPHLSISYDWDAEAQKAFVHIAQTQSGENATPIFNLPLAVDIYDATGKSRREQIRMTKRSQTFEFSASEKPALINVDADKALLCRKDDGHSAEEWAFQYQHAPKFQDRVEALEALDQDESALAKNIFTLALNDSNGSLRERALVHADLKNASVLATVAKIADSDPEPYVRARAIEMLGETDDPKYIPLAQKGLQPDQPYSVVDAALATLTRLDPEAAVAASSALENDDSESIINTLANLYAQHPKAEKAPWFLQKLGKADFMNAFALFESHQKFLVELNDPQLLEEGIAFWKNTATDKEHNSPFRRFGAAKAIVDTRNQMKGTEKAVELDSIFADIKNNETDPTLLMYYGMMQ